MQPADPDGAASTNPTIEERTLAQATERYASMFTHHPHATYSVDRRGYFTDANALSLELTGLSLAELRETHFSVVIHPDDVPLFQAAFDETLSGLPQVIEGRVIRADEEVIDVRCTAIPVIVGDEVVGVHGVTEDVTEANQVLRQLQDANAAKTLFLATVSHEVRTPLAVLAGATELLVGSELAPEPQHYADMVRRSCERLIRLVDDILEFSGLEAHQTVLHPRPFELRALVDDLAAWVEPVADQLGLSVSFDVDDSVPTRLVGDCRRISQVVTNLVHNALRFTEQGSIDVRVSTSNDAAPGDVPKSSVWVDFTVTDTGIGIAEHHARTLFEPFTQVSPHVAGDRQGLGLGLAISSDLVELMGGQLDVSSSLGVGSTFTFGVPLGTVGRDGAA